MQRWEQTYPFKANGTVSIQQEVGAVVVQGWEKPEVHVTAATAGSDRIEDWLQVHEDGSLLQLEVRRPRGLFAGFLSIDSGVDLELKVPEGTHLEIETGAGPVEVVATRGVVRVQSGSGKVAARQIHGTVSIDAGSGAVELEQIGGRADVEVGSGSVAARRIAGDLQIETGSGSLSVADVEGSIELETGSGSITVDRVRGKLLRTETGGGTVRLTQIDVRELEVEGGSGPIQVELVRVHPGGSYQVETGSGGVTVALPREAGLNVSLEAHSGRISYDGIGLRVTHSEQGEIEGVIGGGGAELSIEAGSGGVTLKPYVGPTLQVPVPPAPPAAPPAPPAPPRDAALENSEQLQRILQMVEQGKLTAEEAEALLRALDEEEAPA